MDFPVDEILSSLRTVLQQILPSDFDDSISIVSTLFPISIKPSGIGSFIAPSVEPIGEIRGYHTEVNAQIRVSTTSTLSTLDQALAQIATAFSGLSRRRHLELGILRLGSPEINPEVRQAGQGSNIVLEQKLTCKILYEFLKHPEDSEDIIQTIPLDLELSNPSN